MLPSELDDMLGAYDFCDPEDKLFLANAIKAGFSKQRALLMTYEDSLHRISKARDIARSKAKNKGNRVKRGYFTKAHHKLLLIFDSIKAKYYANKDSMTPEEQKEWKAMILSDIEKAVILDLSIRMRMNSTFIVDANGERMNIAEIARDTCREIKQFRRVIKMLEDKGIIIRSVAKNPREFWVQFNPDYIMCGEESLDWVE